MSEVERATDRRRAVDGVLHETLGEPDSGRGCAIIYGPTRKSTEAERDRLIGRGWHAETVGPVRTHRSGNVDVSLTAEGMLGFTDGSQSAGDGFRYPAGGTNWLYLGGLWVGKEYGKSPAYQRDPLHNISHGATALQTARFYYLLETGRLVGPKLSREMKRMLGKPGIEHKFVKGLFGNSRGTVVDVFGNHRRDAFASDILPAPRLNNYVPYTDYNGHAGNGLW